MTRDGLSMDSSSRWCGDGDEDGDRGVVVGAK